MAEGQEDNLNPTPPLPEGRELIVIVKPEAAIRAIGNSIASAVGADVTSIANLLSSEGATMTPLFGQSEERLKAKTEALASSTSADVPDLSVYYRVEAPNDRLDELAARLRENEIVEAAYVKAPAELPQVTVAESLNRMIPSMEVVPPATPDFTAQQGYLDVAPGGVDARYAWTQSGGGGSGVNVIDVEGAWRFSHEDIGVNQGGVVGGTPTTDSGWRNHGTAVVGEIGGDRNNIGITGIAPDAYVRAISIFGTGSSTSWAISRAADLLNPGDIILIELQRTGPHGNYIAVEWWEDDFAAIRYASSKGVIVVEAAGNGAENLDDSIYESRPAGFPTSWTNPFNRSNRDSGAILVGAGAPPSGNWGPDRSRLDFSNYGASLDAQGWGREVVTCGYGDLQGGTNEDEWYTNQFSGTSSASPIVVGTLACVQGVLRAHGRIPLSPNRARTLLRSTGSPQQDAVGRPKTQRIGNRPDLRQLVSAALQTSTWVGVQFTGTVAAGQTQCWFTYNWPAHWHVVWSVVPTSVGPGGPQISWTVKVQRTSDAYITYWVCITNSSSASVNIEARYAVLGW